MTGDEEGTGSNRRWIVAGIAVLILSLVAGLGVLGTRSTPPPPAVRAAKDCRLHALKYTVTDSAAQFNRQKAFELTDNVIPPAGMYTRALRPVPALHAASHAYVVIFYRFDLPRPTMDGLVSLDQRAISKTAPVIIAPREQDDAMVAIAGGYELACHAPNITSAVAMSRFTKAFYPATADPSDDGSDNAVIDTSPTGAQSPVRTTSK